jgi:simple sugar transport system ATP-binding protein
VPSDDTANRAEGAPTPGSGEPPRLEARALRKTYGGVHAVDGVDLALEGGKIVALVGDNGAGKSTLVKMLSGAVVPTSGEILLDGKPIVLGSVRRARELGIDTVWQELGLVREMDVATNLFLGREITRGQLPSWMAPLSKREMRSRAAEMLGDLGLDMRRFAHVPLGSLSGGQIQAVAVARATFWAQRVIFLDEPTAALGVRESGLVMDLCRTLARRGLAVVIVSHSIAEVLSLVDAVLVLSRGRKVAELSAEEATLERVVSHIVGGADATLAAGTGRGPKP